MLTQPEVAEEKPASGAGSGAPGQHHTEPHVDQPGRFAYRPALDGIRALAVIVIMFYHWALLTSDPIKIFPGGILSVDLFFVLSGYLITTLLLVEWDNSAAISFKNFYLRRARRLLPALVLVMAGVAVLYFLRGVVDLDSGQVEHYRGDALSTVFYVANWNFAFSGQSYFDQFGGPSPLRHMWTLAIEEQFYLIWPILLFVGLKYLRLDRQRFALVAMIGAWLSMIWMAVQFNPAEDPSRLYYGTDTRMQSMLVGAFAAFVLFRRSTEWARKAWGQAFGFAAVLGLLGLFLFASDDPRESPWIYTGGFLLTAAIGACAVATASGPQQTPFGRVMGWAPLAWVGRVSYGLYLWHWPVLVVLDTSRTGLGGFALLALRASVTVVLATASFYVIESPIRFHGFRHSKTRVLSFAGGALAGLLILTAIITVNPGEDDVAAFPVDDSGQLDAGDATVAAGDLKVLVAGDSMAYTLFRFKPELPGVAVKTSSLLGCGISGGRFISEGQAVDPPYGDCDDWPQRWSEQVQGFDPDVTLAVIGGWEVFDHQLDDGTVLEVGTDAYADYLRSQLDEVVAVTTATGGKLVLLNTPCFKVLKPGTPGSWPEKNDTSRVDWVNLVFSEWAADHPEVVLADVHGFLCPSGDFVGEVNGVPYTDDGTHYTKEGAPLVWGFLAPYIDKAVNG